MKLVLFIFLSIQVYIMLAQDVNIRDSYFSAGVSHQGIKNFYDQSTALNESLPIERAYKGVAIAMYAEVVNSVHEKFDFFNRGKELLESAVAADWYNPEIRFLRFSVQVEVPFIVGYSDKMNEDAYVVIDALEKGYINRSVPFWKNAINFMNQSGELNKDQQKRLKPFLT